MGSHPWLQTTTLLVGAVSVAAIMAIPSAANASGDYRPESTAAPVGSFRLVSNPNSDFAYAVQYQTWYRPDTAPAAQAFVARAIERLRDGKPVTLSGIHPHQPEQMLPYLLALQQRIGARPGPVPPGTLPPPHPSVRLGR
jgi:hypothetical protein